MKMFNKKYLGVAALTLGLFSASHFAYAFQPAGISWKITDSAIQEGPVVAGENPGGESQLYVNLKFFDAKQKLPLLVLIPNCGQDPEIAGKPLSNLSNILSGKDQSPLYNTKWIKPGPRWRICPKVDALLINDLTSNQILPLEVDFLSAVNGGISPSLFLDVYEISASDVRLQLTVDELARKYRNQAPAARVPVSADYLISKGTFKLGNYNQTYGNPVPAFNSKLPIPTGVKKSLSYDLAASVMPVNLESFRRKLKIPGNISYDKLASLQNSVKLSLDRGSAKEGAQICYPENPVLAGALTPNALVPISHTLSGQFSTKWTTDHSLHSAFGFLVEAWRVSPAVKLGSAWVQANGSWSIGVPTSLGFPGGAIRINYLSYNGYYAPQNQAGNKYWWSDTWTVASSAFTTGHRYVDTDGGTYNGVGELVNSAMTMWSRLYWDAGINPVAASPIKFFFPNTWYDCGDGSNSPWSCATFEGDQIWLIAAHGTQGDVVNHEMGHALQAKFWGGKRAAGSGGSHTLTGCYPTRLGLALGEGFANFMGAWVGYPERNQAEGSFASGIWGLSFEPEQRTSPPTCANGWENETWVARTFWDLHDTHADGDDILWFNYPGAVISLFLNNSVATSGDARDMRFYRNIYSTAASLGHQGYISDIFNQNRQ
jgi:hypothetical protein